jgi:hypothetical protein
VEGKEFLDGAGLCYHELPQVKDQLGYQPDGYMASVARRRLATYGGQLPAHPPAMTGPVGRCGEHQFRARGQDDRRVLPPRLTRRPG